MHPTCTSCRKAERAIAEAGITAQRRDFFSDRFSADELRDLFVRAGIGPQDALATRANAYRELGLAGRTLGDDEIIALMVEHPTLIRRPLIVGQHGAVQGFNTKQLATFVAREK